MKKTWIYYFVVLAVLGTLAIVIPILYNLSLQLTPEQVREAKEKWNRKGPSDYDLRQEVKIDMQKKADIYEAKVRDGVIIEAKCNGREISKSEVNVLTVPEFFELIERGLELDQVPDQRKNYAVAYFEKHLGYPARYIRRKRGSKERLEINMKVTPITP